KYIPPYFRHHFTVSDPSTIAALSVLLQRDDGAVVYLNGNEVFRSNMPTGAINYLTLASSGASGTNRTSFFASPAVDAARLVPGDNVMAAEVHQHAADSSGLDFNLALVATNQPAAP